MPHRDDGSAYERLEDSPRELLLWAPSIRAIAESTSYEDYLRRMDEYFAATKQAVDEAFPPRPQPERS